MKILIEISDTLYKYLKKRIELGMASEIDKVVWNGKRVDNEKHD